VTSFTEQMWPAEHPATLEELIDVFTRWPNHPNVRIRSALMLDICRRLVAVEAGVNELRGEAS